MGHVGSSILELDMWGQKSGYLCLCCFNLELFFFNLCLVSPQIFIEVQYEITGVAL